MKIQIKTVDKERGIAQITTLDERWYRIPDEMNEQNILVKRGGDVPSVTWIASFYPKGIAYFKWLAEHGWNEAEAIKNEAAEKGSKVHSACEDLLKGQEVKMTAEYLNHGTEKMEELTPDEYECVMSLADWLKETNPEIISTEYNTWNSEDGYAGTVDAKVKINGEVWIIDFKTSQYIWPSHELQLSAYRHADPDYPKTGILQLGYRRNKNKYKFTEVADKYSLFEAAKYIWAAETEGIVPLQKDYPLVLKWAHQSLTETKPAEGAKVVKTKHKTNA